MKKAYSHINFKPPKSVRLAAKRGLELRKRTDEGIFTLSEKPELVNQRLLRTWSFLT